MVNQKGDLEAFNKNVSYLISEQDCKGIVSSEAKVSKSISELYLKAIEGSPQNFFSVVPRTYNFDSPMVLSLYNMNKSYQSLKTLSDTGLYSTELFNLYNENRRYEDQKCSFQSLKEKRKYDIRPYLNIAHHCIKKFKNEVCEESEYHDMSIEKEKWTKGNTVELCKSFDKDINCQAEYNVNFRRNTISTMIKRYYGRFRDERFFPLFKLRPLHQKYNCEKIDEDKIIMTIKVLEGPYSHDWLVELLSYVESVWSNKKFALKIELVKKYSDGVVILNPTDKGISYVPDNNNRMVYLSTQSDNAVTKRVLAHEFGHVLGFPDCYIEFFDDFKKELVYYEISKNNYNIMCSLKTGVEVPEDYLDQLTQNSCLFN